MVTISVAFQFIIGMISGMFADRIGRVKPFLFMHGSIFLVTLICFIVMPKIDGCDTKKITLHCIDERLTAQDSCQISQDTFHKDSCSLIDSENATHYDENENCPFVSLLLQMDFNIENYHKNEISGFCLYQVNFKNYSSKDIPPCEIQKCEAFHVVCSKKGISSDCLKSRSSWILVYGILVVLYNTSRTNIYRFFDIIAMDLSNQYNSDFGKQRLCSLLGLTVGPSLAGFISHKITSNESDKSYTPVFVCAAIFAALAFIPVWKVNPKFHKPAATVWKKSFEFVMNLEIILFLILLLTMGISFGFIIIYGNWAVNKSIGVRGGGDLFSTACSKASRISSIMFISGDLCGQWKNLKSEVCSWNSEEQGLFINDVVSILVHVHPSDAIGNETRQTR
ncbi:hypothetical protein AVEN_261906-1 [Araneus ventricosus]|uniref:Major facilitator superfamily associated domain-containing protein n=1 Tax=Araneus ventricosus TaxID=182803 RepID=A0A4Y2UX55_ARAVE|nr:hypothetical protein AVEN_261906-1 [Araneus ventricosus]